MKKIILMLFSIFMLSSVRSSAHVAVICDGSGVARLVEFTFDQYGIPITTSSTYFSACDGIWFCMLSKVTPSGTQPSPELSSTIYDQLNSTEGFVPSDFTHSEAADFQALVEERYPTRTERWIDPFKLSSLAYAAIYGSEVYEMFYVHTAVRVSDGANILKLYSNSAKTMNVTYKTILGVYVDSESVSVSAGSNDVELTKPAGMSNGTYNVVVTGSTSYVNTTIVVSH